MFFRSDGLLRGSREERVEAMLSLQRKRWDLEAFSELHCGLLDHAEEVRAVAMDTLKAIAKSKPEPIALTPVKLLSNFLFAFTVSSGVRVDTFKALVELGTPEAREAVGQILDTQRNEDFRDFVEVLEHANRLGLLRQIDPSKLSKTKAAIRASVWG